MKNYIDDEDSTVSISHPLHAYIFLHGMTLSIHADTTA